MAKKSLVIRDFSAGLRGTGHGADLPDNALVGGYNHNVYRNAGLIEPSGSWISAQKPDEGTDNMENWTPPDAYIPMRGRGLFYFTSDYDNLKVNPNVALEHPVNTILVPGWTNIAGGWIDPGDPPTDGNFMTGQTGALNACEYFILGTRRAAQAQVGVSTTHSGENSMALHIYQVRRDTTYADTPEGTYNGWLVDIPMGMPGFYDGNVSEFIDETNPTYSSGWFPVYYYARGAVRVCDGGFLEKNSSKLFIGYQKDPKYFSPIYDLAQEADAEDIVPNATSGWANSHEHPNFEVDQWIIDKGHPTAPGLLYSPKVTGMFLNANEHGYNASGAIPNGNKNITAHATSQDTVYFIHARRTGDDLFLGKSFSDLNVIMPHPGDWGDAYGYNEQQANEIPEGVLFLGLSVQTTESLNAYNNWDGNDEEEDFYNSIEGNINILTQGETNTASVQNIGIWITYIYDTGEESIPTVIKTISKLPTQDDTDNNNTTDWPGTSVTNSYFINQLIYGDNLFMKLHAFVNPNRRKAHPRIQGARVYMSNTFYGGEETINKDSELAFVGEVHFSKGIRGAGQSGYNMWQYDSDRDFDPYDMAPMYYGNSDFIPTLGVETFRTFHGYDWTEIKPCYYKTAVTVNNRVYAGNVKFGDVLYPDRMMKTQIGEFDTWTEHGFIDVAVDDGDSITHLEAFGDRILQFKRNALHIINIEKQFEFLELSTKHAGVGAPCQVVSTELGVFWVNKKGIYLYNGQTVKNLLQSSDLGIMSASVTLDVAKKPVVQLTEWENLISEKEGYEPIVSYSPHSKEILIQGQSNVDFGFIWNIERGVLTQTFNKGSNSTNGIKSNSIITIDGTAMYFEGTQYDDPVALHDPGDILILGQMRKWDSSPQALNGLNLFLLTKAIDFGNHSQRKVVQSISFTYRSDGLSRLLPYVNIWYLDGTSPSTYYLCDDTAVAGDLTTVQIVSDSNTHMQLPDTSSKFETFTYKHLGETGVGPTSLRSVMKNIGAVQIGLVKNSSSNDTDADFELEEISITYREKQVK